PDEALTRQRARVSSRAPQGIAPIAQLDRALVYGTRCRKFESSWARRGLTGAGRAGRRARQALLCRAVGEMTCKVPVGNGDHLATFAGGHLVAPEYAFYPAQVFRTARILEQRRR